jgi:hypothetical protein
MASSTLSEPSSAQSAPATESAATTKPELTSRDFRFLRRLNPLLAGYIERAFEFSDEYPEECLTNLRKFAEYVQIYVASAAQISNAAASAEGDNEDQRFSKRINDLRDYIEDGVFIAIKNIWFECGTWGPHPPKKFPLTKGDLRAHKKKLRSIVIPTFEKALKIAEWLQNNCSNEQSRWARMVSVFFPLPIGLKDQLAKKSKTK